MKKAIAFVTGGVGAAAAFSAVFSAGVAHADDLTGKTYSDAAAEIAKMNGKAVVSTVVGDQLAKDQCIVAGWHKGSFLDDKGAARGAEYLLSLNCNQALAAPGDPGNSLSTPQGQQRKKILHDAAIILDTPAACEQSDAMHTFCVNFCKEHSDLCTYPAAS